MISTNLSLTKCQNILNTGCAVKRIEALEWNLSVTGAYRARVQRLHRGSLSIMVTLGTMLSG